MLEFLLFLVIMYAVFRVLLSLGIGIAKIVFGLIGLAVAFVILPLTLALIIPVAIGAVFLFAIVGIVKTIAR